MTMKTTINEKLADNLRYLRLHGLRENWDEYLRMAASKRWSHARLLTYIIDKECELKLQNAGQLRLKRARLPEQLVIETFPFDKQPKLNRKKVMNLYDSLTYMHNSQNIIWLGATGCGKTGLATSFLINVINQGYSGRYVLFADLINHLYRSVADHTEQKVLRKYLSWDCLLIDEIGYVEVEPVQVGLFFTLMQQRHKKKPTLITSNLGFSDWGSFLKNDHLTAALVDRLTENSHVFNMRGCRSLRPKLS